MKVLRKRDLRKVGKRGEVVEVSDGYGANYIIPMGYGVLFTKQAQLDFAKEQAEEKKIHDEKVEQAKEIAEKRKTITLEFSAPAVQFLSKRQVKPGKNNMESTSTKTGLLTKMSLSMALD